MDDVVNRFARELADSIAAAVRGQVRGRGMGVEEAWQVIEDDLNRARETGIFKDEREIFTAAGLKSFEWRGSVYEPDKWAIQFAATRRVYVSRAVYAAIRWLPTRIKPFSAKTRFDGKDF